VAVAYLSELDFEVFEMTECGLIAHAPSNKIDRVELDEIKKQLEAIAEKVVWAESIVKTENWNAKWEEEYEHVNVDDLALVRAPFHSPPEQGLDIIIKPNMSFGTGHHDTTWMMIRAILDLDVKGQTVLDMGCGTGVLALAASKLGASRVCAIDIEEGAVENTHSNAILNSVNVDDSFVIDCGTSELLTKKHPELNNIILANINRNVLIADMSAYNNVLAPSGSIVFSGFFSGDVDLMSEHITNQGWQVKSVLNRNGWACIICGKPAK
jgi:ribosomal protein L11 methyltransferase